VGKCSIGIRAKDIVTLIDWISSRDEFDMDNLACMGLSGGGMMTMYASALDERIRRVLIAGYLTEMKGSILGVRHCGCNYVPHLAAWMDFPDITGLIAPRPLIAVTGKRDAIFPIDSFHAAAEKVRNVYAVMGKPDNFVTREHAGFHSFDPGAIDDLLV
jgi:pimeloyl-ACP methyl ester carboxylesterase